MYVKILQYIEFGSQSTYFYRVQYSDMLRLN
jgi:hypothetical protein